MVELISKISKGTNMDQVYIPKKREDFAIGSYVLIKPLEIKPEKEIKPFFYNIKNLEPIKIYLVKEILKIIDKYIEPENIIITGSFLDKGFRFNDIDVLIVTGQKTDINHIKGELKSRIGAAIHLIPIKNKALIEGLSTDPLYRIMLSKCVSKKRIIHKTKITLNYKLLDLHLLKSKLLIDNFDLLTGDEKYEMVRNLVAINLFIGKKELTKSSTDLAINNFFGHNTVEKLKNNTLTKKYFLDKYKKIYNDARNKILKGI